MQMNKGKQLNNVFKNIFYYVQLCYRILAITTSQQYQSLQ